MLQTEESPVTTELDDDDIEHAVCGECWPVIEQAQYAICGEYVGDFDYDPQGFNEDEPDSCVLCALTEVCPVCGYRFVD